MDLINTDTERDEVDMETKEMRQSNQEEAEQLDVLFTRKQDLETTMRQLENEIEEVSRLSDSSKFSFLHVQIACGCLTMFIPKLLLVFSENIFSLFK